MFKIIFIVIIIIIIIALVYIIFNHSFYTNRTKYIKEGTHASIIKYNNPTIIKIPPIKSHNITYSFWLNITDFYFNNNKWKHIFHCGTDINNKTFDSWEDISTNIPNQYIGVWMHPNINNIRVCLNSKNGLEYFDLDNIPINEITLFNIHIINNIINININNKLTYIHRINIALSDKFEYSKIFFNFTTTINGTIYDFLYLPRTITNNEINNKFKNPPYSYKNSIRYEFIKNTHSFDGNIIVKGSQIPLSEKGVQFSYSFDLLINTITENQIWKYNYKHKKTIIDRYGSPNISYIPYENTLVFEINYKNKNNEVLIYDIPIKNIKLQRFNNIIFTLNGRYVNIYIDNSLKYSNIIPYVPYLYSKDLSIGYIHNIFSGSIKNGVYYNNAILI